VASVPPLTPMAALRWSVVRPIVDALGPRRVLEVGCGQGSFGARLAARADYVGVEPDEKSFLVARERIERHGGTVLHGLAGEIPGDRQFDLVCAFEVIEHLEHDGAALADWAGRVRPGGALLVSVPAWPQRFGPMDGLVGHYRRYRPEDVDDALADAGCTDVRHTLYGWPLGYVLEAVRNRIAVKRGMDDEGTATDEDTMADRSATSGRLFQPRQVAGAAVRMAVAPFAGAQKLRPGTGTGLVAVGTVR
jgi:SAM-dependent methyltransferase